MFTVLGYCLDMRHESVYDCEDTVHVAVFWVMKLCNPVGVSKNFGENRILHPKCRMQSVEDASRIFLQNPDIHIAVYMVS